ncbi:dTDP-4-amino-4,6-dideoxygalactose transaminase [Agromyces sp. ISL-38]|uniref:dTDP-4-amino-4,6-dideoxygalactose transaminase n=1 Tax=Agromyces sp. ISL-38 TaxID=2819107 RepID=UPI001BEA0D5A|nr:dTDP-4-amino-4,6-dideoxygalactose transaminase [Agromyces sp. ISL-38]MBT2500327.1 dTDP-4-amino-4,6-dideoxygalactose transaminase [Agromyces sp. ISL-38]
MFLQAETIPFSRPFLAPGSLERLGSVLSSDHAHGDGPFTRAATEKLKVILGGGGVFLTTSGTHALEMASRLLDLAPGDEVVLPSFTFSSAATAVAMTGARIVFVDIDPATGNIDPEQAAEAVTARTRAISVMHYGGTPVDMAAIATITAGRDIAVIEDNAHGLGVRTELGVLGRIGDLGVQSFHDTKNVHSGEGGALVINDDRYLQRAEIMREKGTNRAQFLRGMVDKYSWVDWGSSYLPSELNAAVLDAQLAVFDEIQFARHAIWNRYAAELAEWAAHVGIRLMNPPGGTHAAHLFYLLMPGADDQTDLIASLRTHGIVATFHYVPLDTSIAGRRYGRALRTLEQSERFSRRLVRLPLWVGMTEAQVDRVIKAVREWRPKREVS